MPAYLPPDGLTKLALILSGVEHEARMADHRRRVAVLVGCVSAAVFLVLLSAETLFATLIFSIISVEILCNFVSGAAFSLIVPTVIFAAHIKLHHEADHFTKMWLKRLTSIGILFFVLGMSLMVGFSAWEAARDAVSVIDAGPTGMLGGRAVGATESEPSSITSWIGVIPNGLLFLGLSFGMIITVYVASFFLGRALEAFNLLTLTPPVGKEVKAAIKSIKSEAAVLRSLQIDDDVARRKLPFDLKHRFAREAFNACWTILQGKLGASRRKFNTERLGDPMAIAFHDPEVDGIPSRFVDEESFDRHLADQMDQMRIHNVLRILTGLTTEHGKEPS
ncbi:MAG: hypothetical protein KDK08_26950 [Rhizobiaceae bacterium]|nr:hypothetical protein [Rhizobiaceae bacterium]